MGRLNDILRAILAVSFRALAVVLGWNHRRHIARFRSSQVRLRHRYGVDKTTAIHSYDAQVKEAVLRLQQQRGGYLAETSGTTAESKLILYTAGRLRQVMWTYSEVFVRTFAALGLWRTSLYVFGSLAQDNSLSSMMLGEKGKPSRISLLQAPYRAHSLEPLRRLLDSYSAAAVRIWVLALSNPSMIYATNPSTMATFWDTVQRDWLRSSELVRDYVRSPQSFDADLRSLARTLASVGSLERMRTIADAAQSPEVECIVPALRAFVCWDGGYVAPFLERVRQILPPERVAFVPMYSMSTETIETLTHFEGEAIRFLPLGRRVLYEFLPEHGPDTPEHLLLPWELEEGRLYSMVVSDSYGLLRYHTGDLFECRGYVGACPDLRFSRRRGLSYSFTGEKITGEQILGVFEHVRKTVQAPFLTCVPCRGGNVVSQTGAMNTVLPHYKIVLIGDGGDPQEIARMCDARLQHDNSEYAAKRQTARLDPMQGVRMPPVALATMVGADPKTWESQFKFLPLYQQLWQTPHVGEIPPENEAPATCQ